MFPHKLTDTRAFDVARAMLDGFNRHYRLFREASASAKARFERADWHGQQRAQRERIEYYDQRVNEAVDRLRGEFHVDKLSMDSWQQVKLHYIGLLTDHHQPELAETFFNSVTAKLLHRSYFRNDFIFVRPAVSTEYIENDEPAATPTYRAYYPTRESLHETMVRIVDNFQLQCEFEHLDATPQRCWKRCSARGPALRGMAAARQLPDPGAEFAVLPQQGRLHRGQGDQRLHRDPDVPADRLQRQRPARDRHGAVQRRRTAAGVQLRARLLHGRHGGAQRLRAVPARPDAAQAARRALQRAGPAEARQEPVLPRPVAAPAAQLGPLPHRARHQGHGDAGVRPAVLPLRVQGASRTSTRRRRTPRASRSRASTCWSSSTTAWAAWPIRWSTATWPSRAAASRTNWSPS
jgi:hypothetical protein